MKVQNFIKSFFESLFALVKVLLLSHFKTRIKRNKQSNACLILGNGPSLEGMLDKHSDFVRDKDLICVNHFPSSPLYEVLKPEYYITAAPELWLDNVEEKYKLMSRRTFKALKEKTSWPLKLLIPFSAQNSGDWYEHIKQNPNIEVLYYNDTGIEGFSSLIFWFFRKGLAMPRPHNVLVPSLINAVNMGYTTIYLWGAENNQFLELTVDENNNALIHQKHFYDRDTSKPKTMHKLGRGKRRVHEILHKFMLSFAAYHEIEKYARQRNARIINQTPDSLIDAFERGRVM